MKPCRLENGDNMSAIKIVIVNCRHVGPIYVEIKHSKIHKNSKSSFFGYRALFERVHGLLCSLRSLYFLQNMRKSTGFEALAFLSNALRFCVNSIAFFFRIIEIYFARIYV